MISKFSKFHLFATGQWSFGDMQKPRCSKTINCVRDGVDALGLIPMHQLPFSTLHALPCLWTTSNLPAFGWSGELFLGWLSLQEDSASVDPSRRVIPSTLSPYKVRGLFCSPICAKEVRKATGAGKSLCMFLALLAAQKNGIGIVISPLNGLMDEQVLEHAIPCMPNVTHDTK